MRILYGVNIGDVRFIDDLSPTSSRYGLKVVNDDKKKTTKFHVVDYAHLNAKPVAEYDLPFEAEQHKKWLNEKQGKKFNWNGLGGMAAATGIATGVGYLTKEGLKSLVKGRKSKSNINGWLQAAQTAGSFLEPSNPPSQLPREDRVYDSSDEDVGGHRYFVNERKGWMGSKFFVVDAETDRIVSPEFKDKESAIQKCYEMNFKLERPRAMSFPRYPSQYGGPRESVPGEKTLKGAFIASLIPFVPLVVGALAKGLKKGVEFYKTEVMK